MTAAGEERETPLDGLPGWKLPLGMLVEKLFKVLERWWNKG